MRRGFWVILINALLTLASVTVVWACSCMAPATVDDAMNASTAVFFGTLRTIVPLNGQYPIQSEQPVAVTFAVRESWKGPQTPTITLYTVINGMSCNGYFWKEGAAFLVYAHRAPDGRFGVGLCSRTVEAAWAAADLQVLGPGQAPKPDPIPEESHPAVKLSDPFPWTTVLFSMGILSGLIAIGVVQQRRAAYASRIEKDRVK